MKFVTNCTYTQMKMMNRSVLIVDLLSFVGLCAKNFDSLQKNGMAEARNKIKEARDDELEQIIELC